MTGLYADRIPDEVKANVRQTRTNWQEPFRWSDDLRVHTPVLDIPLSRQTKAHLASMDTEYRARLEREWSEAEASITTGEPISEEIKDRAAREWEQSNA